MVTAWVKWETAKMWLVLQFKYGGSMENQAEAGEVLEVTLSILEMFEFCVTWDLAPLPITGNVKVTVDHRR